MALTMAVILYARVSTRDQTIEHQQIQAEAAGFVFDDVIYDVGVSGVATKLKERPEGKRLFDILRAGDTLVVRWIDRLGRNYGDVTDTMRTLLTTGVIIRTVINAMVFDGTSTDPMQKAVRDAMLSFMAAMAEAQADAIKQAQQAGIAHAKKNDRSYRGRKPSYNRSQLNLVQKLLEGNETVANIAAQTRLTRQTIYRIKNDPAAAYANIETWT